MIRVDDIEDQFDLDLGKQEDIELELSVDEMALIHSLDADVEDAAVYRRPGELFEVSIAREIPPSVVAALKRLWEAGGWVVGAFEIVDPKTGLPLRERVGESTEHVFRLVFARPHKLQRLPSQVVLQALEKRKEAEEFEVPDAATIERIAGGRARTSIPLLIRMPTRSRPAQALEVLAKYRELAMEHVAIEVIIDSDDQTCNNTQFLQQLADLDCVVTVGQHKNKIEACNAGRVEDWSILMLASDDMWPRARGFDQKIITAMERHFPLLDGCLNFDDGFNKDHVRPGEPITNTLPIMGRHLYEEYGRRVYWPEYRSVYCDTEMSFLFNKMNRMAFVDEVIIEHRHFANSKARFDELYEFNSRHDGHDKELFEARRAHGFDAPRVRLSILVCSVSSRRRQLERLVAYLRWQKQVLVQPAMVEICVDMDEEITVGEKRQRLLERAVGDYVAFIDDDDWVDSKYVERVIAACGQSKDCCSLIGVITENGSNPRRFEHSLEHSGWYTREDGVYIRTPNHLNAVRRSLALKAGFVAKDVGEDHAYSTALGPLIKTEASTGDTPLYMYWSMPQKSVQRGAAQ